MFKVSLGGLIERAEMPGILDRGGGDIADPLHALFRDNHSSAHYIQVGSIGFEDN